MGGGVLRHLPAGNVVLQHSLWGGSTRQWKRGSDGKLRGHHTKNNSWKGLEGRSPKAWMNVALSSSSMENGCFSLSLCDSCFRGDHSTGPHALARLQRMSSPAVALHIVYSMSSFILFETDCSWTSNPPALAFSQVQRLQAYTIAQLLKLLV